MNDLIRRAMQRYLAGRGGRRTLLRLQQGGVTSSQLAGAAQPVPLPVDAGSNPTAALAAQRAAQEQRQTVTAGAGGVADALGARRDANALRAIIRARAAIDSGQEVGAATQARLRQASGSGFSQLDLLRAESPEQRAAAASQAVGGLRKLRPRTRSSSRSYSY